MQQTKKTGAVLLAMVLLMALLPAAGITVIPSANASTYGDWTYTVSNGDATISKYTGTATSVKVPAKIGNYSVTRLEGLASYYPVFSNSIKSVTIPNSVTEIGAATFRNCSSLTEITIPGSVTAVGRYAFEGCTALTKIIIPDSVTAIGRSAFSGCRGLSSVTISKNVTLIEASAFSRCSGLTSVTIPNSVTTIGESAFSGCTGLTSITIPKSVTEIDDSAFYECTALKSAYFTSGVESIGKSAFANCSSLTVVSIPDSVVKIDNTAFNGCPFLTIYGNENSFAQTYADDNKIPISFKAAPESFNVTFKKNGGSGSMSKQLYLSGTAQKLTSNTFTRKGYVFAGWATSASGKVKYTNKKSITITENTTLYAVWTKVTAPTKTVTSLKLTSPKTKQLKVTYKAVSGAAGYKIEYSTGSKFTKSTTKTVHTTKLNYTIKSLKAKTKYYVRVTAYKTDSVKAKIYSKKTAAKNLTIK